MTTPPPLPERPLVEAWAVRDDDDGHLWHGTYQGTPQQVRDFVEAHERMACTVVPLTAADRLTDEALVEAVARIAYDTEVESWGTPHPGITHPTWSSLSQNERLAAAEHVRPFLAALRTHLERP